MQRNLLEWVARRLAALVAGAAIGAISGQPVDFTRDVRPLLAERCFPCHGPDAALRQAGMRLDQRESATRRTLSGRVPIVPGDPDSSELVRRVGTADESVRMPPQSSTRAALDPLQVDLLRQWIREGAAYEGHWAFSPPRRPPPPAVSDPSWIRSGIDPFVLWRLDAEGLAPSPKAGAAVWLRRMTLDLHGLPPSWPETVAFARDAARRGEFAFEAAVDRALASPRYGERMATDWMDVARYADTHGYNNDSERSMWRWRDWVIDAFNSNLPYDRFITDQLAGDLLPDPTLGQRIATGFNRNHGINSEGGIIDEEYRVEYVADRVRTVGMAWLGVTLECARCHDHRYDPISQRDYYRLFAFFNNQPEYGEAGRVANAAPFTAAPTTSQAVRLRALRETADRLENEERRALAAWRPGADDLEALRAPRSAGQPDLSVACDDGGVPGVSGPACLPMELGGAELGELSSGGDFTLSLWLRADRPEADAPLFSAIDYDPDQASAVHGAGVQLRLVRDELELRLSHRFPSYSITVRTQGAGIRSNQWHHAAARYASLPGQTPPRARASYVRLFVDGREVATQVLNDDLQSAASFREPYLIGLENGRQAKRFSGRIDELGVWRTALPARELREVFETVALPWALQRARFPRERGWLFRALRSESRAEAARRHLFSLRRELPTTMVMQELAVPRQTRVLRRGRYDAPGEPVGPGVPEELLGAWPKGQPKTRLGLARWLTRPDHPTTARVVVNRFWQQFFGSGLVRTSEDFGTRGEAPSHPALLDWMAAEFVDSGWDVKRLLRQIVLSATYRQASVSRPAVRDRDPDNRLLARGPIVRLPAEAIRDQALAVAGLLGSQVGGPSVRPHQPKGLYEGIVVGEAFPGTTWDQGVGDELYRRSLYTFWKRTLPHPLMTVFDAPHREVCTARRQVTNTPLQALALMNAPVFTEAAREIAGHVLEEAAGARARSAALYRVVLGREPLPEETGVMLDVRSRLMRSYRWDRAAAREAAGHAARGPWSLDEWATYTALASLVLNLDEAITKR